MDFGFVFEQTFGENTYRASYNREIVYTSTRDGLIISGTGMIGKNDIWTPYGKVRAADHYALELSDGIIGAETGFLENFVSLMRLTLAPTVTDLVITDELKRIFTRNSTLVRGVYDTFAERFAKETGLRFIHSDIPLFVDGSDPKSSLRVSLSFGDECEPFIHYRSISGSGTEECCSDSEKQIDRKLLYAEDTHSFSLVFPERLRKVVEYNHDLSVFLRKYKERNRQF